MLGYPGPPPGSPVKGKRKNSGQFFSLALLAQAILGEILLWQKTFFPLKTTIGGGEGRPQTSFPPPLPLF